MHRASFGLCITSLLDREAQVSSESIDDTLNDLINYAAILKLYIKENRQMISIIGPAK